MALRECIDHHLDMPPHLTASSLFLVMTGLVGIFLPFSKTTDLIFAAGGTLLFSGYVVYDTYMINNRLSPDEYIMAAISLYLDFINLCTSMSPLFCRSSEAEGSSFVQSSTFFVSSAMPRIVEELSQHGC